MPNPHQIKFAQIAKNKVESFLQSNPHYTQQGVSQPNQGATNHVVFLQSDTGKHVLKIFCQLERKERERFALQHWQEIGFVPQIIWDEEPDSLLITYVPGDFLNMQTGPPEKLAEICFEVGQAFGKLSRISWTDEHQKTFQSTKYGERTIDLKSWLEQGIEQARSYQNPNFQSKYWQESINFVEQNIDTILSQPRYLCHGDAGHIHVSSDHFIGIYDTEMCFVGCQAMQLSLILNSNGLRRFFAEDLTRWNAFCNGWQTITNQNWTTSDFEAVIAAHNWRCWQQILSYSPDPKTKTYHNRIETAKQIVYGMCDTTIIGS